MEVQRVDPVLYISESPTQTMTSSTMTTHLYITENGTAELSPGGHGSHEQAYAQINRIGSASMASDIRRAEQHQPQPKGRRFASESATAQMKMPRKERSRSEVKDGVETITEVNLKGKYLNSNSFRAFLNSMNG